MSRTILVILAVAALLLIVLLATGVLNVNQTKEARLPNVDVSAQGGQAPAFDVDAKEVVVGTKKTDVTVPDVSIDSKKTEIDVPVVGVKDGNNN
jgi:cell division protein FtsX